MSVIVPAHNAEGTLPRTLDCLLRQDFDGAFEVIVVDDGSQDATPDIAAAAPAPVRLVKQEGLGAAAARNRGAAEASAAELAFLDSDCFPTPGWLSAGLAARRDFDVVQGWVLPDPDDAAGPWDHALWVETETALYESANLFMSRASFDSAGGFTEPFRPTFGRPMGEDTYLGWRLRRSGARITLTRGALVHHAVVRRRWWDHVAERRRDRYFPELVRQIPELRRELCFARLFLGRRSAAFDLAVAGVAVAAARRAPLALAATAPYLWLERRERLGRFDGAHARIAIGDAIADAVGLVSRLEGSVRARSPVL